MIQGQLKRWSSFTRIFLWGGCVIGLVATVWFVVQYRNTRTSLEEAAFNNARQQASSAAADINGVFSGVMSIADNIANDLSSGKLAYADFRKRLESEVKLNPSIDGLAVTFEPFVYNPVVKLYQSYYYQQADGSFANLDGASYDYSVAPGDDPKAPKTAWYHEPLEKGAMWQEPFLATGAGKVLIEYGVPFYQVDATSNQRIPAGVVTIDYSLQGMRDLMSKLELGATGYGYVVSANGTFLAYPVQEQVARSTIFQLADSLGDQDLKVSIQRAIKGESFSSENRDSVTGQVSWDFFEPIPATHWTLGIVLNKTEFQPNPRVTLQEQVNIVLGAMLLILCVAGLLIRVYEGTSRSLWLMVGLFTVLSMVTITVIWSLATTIRTREGVPITNQTAVNRYVESYTHNLSVADPPILVPTGIQITAIQFPDATSVAINALIWMRYNTDISNDITRGFLLPQIISEQYTVDEVQRTKQGNEWVIVWSVNTVLRQEFNTQQFPFDSRDITLQISPRDLEHNIVLTPDLSAYNLINPSLLPGVDRGVNINNWTIESSQFTYRSDLTKTNLGILARNERNNHPDLTFTINSQRGFVGPFIAYLLPGVVAAGMLFAFLLNDREVGDREELVNSLNYAAALFFVIAVAHTALRENIAAVGITYLESLYILLYFAIIGVAMNTFLIVKRPNASLLHYRNNLIPKLAYWLLIMGSLLVVTLSVFVWG